MPVDTSVFERQRRGIEDDYAAKSAAATFGRFTGQQRFKRDTADAYRQFSQQTPRFTASYGKRGMTGPGVQSGVYRNALTNYASGFQRDQAASAEDYDTEQNQYQMQLNQYAADRERALADMELDKAKEIAMAAANIQALKPFFTGS
jgi:hypothetical protein